MPTTECRVWRGARNNLGYGIIVREGRKWLVHRWIMHLVGHDIEGKLVLHTCDNPPCFRYDHLVIGTHKDNTQDMVRKGRARGNTQPNARRKLTIEQAREALTMPGPAWLAAERFGVHASAIVQLRRRETYKEIQ
jgi:hypothetical protein